MGGWDEGRARKCSAGAEQRKWPRGPSVVGPQTSHFPFPRVVEISGSGSGKLDVEIDLSARPAFPIPFPLAVGKLGTGTRKIPLGIDGHKPDRDQSQFVLFCVDHRLARSTRRHNPIPVGEKASFCVGIRNGNKIETVTYRDQTTEICPSEK